MLLASLIMHVSYNLRHNEVENLLALSFNHCTHDFYVHPPDFFGVNVGNDIIIKNDIVG